MTTEAQILTILIALSAFTCFPVYLLYSLLVPASRFTLVERALQIHLFMQNKPNLRKAEMFITPVLIKGYINIPLRRRSKNKPKSKPIEPNRQNPKMSSNFYITSDYEKNRNFTLPKTKPTLEMNVTFY